MCNNVQVILRWQQLEKKLLTFFCSNLMIQKFNFQLFIPAGLSWVLIFLDFSISINTKNHHSLFQTSSLCFLVLWLLVPFPPKYIHSFDGFSPDYIIFLLEFIHASLLRWFLYWWNKNLSLAQNFLCSITSTYFYKIFVCV